MGCGVGNTLFPVMELHPEWTYYAFDVAQSAVDILKQHSLLTGTGATSSAATAITCHACVCDISLGELPDCVPQHGVDIATLMFVLSALPRHTMAGAVRAIRDKLKTGGLGFSPIWQSQLSGLVTPFSFWCAGGRLLFRDFVKDDYRERLFSAGDERKMLGDGYFQRGDGTLVTFFDPGPYRADLYVVCVCDLFVD